MDIQVTTPFNNRKNYWDMKDPMCGIVVTVNTIYRRQISLPC